MNCTRLRAKLLRKTDDTNARVKSNSTTFKRARFAHNCTQNVLLLRSTKLRRAIVVRVCGSPRLSKNTHLQNTRPRFPFDVNADLFRPIAENRFDPADNTKIKPDTWFVFLKRRRKSAEPPPNKARRKDSRQTYLHVMITWCCPCFWFWKWTEKSEISASFYLQASHSEAGFVKTCSPLASPKWMASNIYP